MLSSNLLKNKEKSQRICAQFLSTIMSYMKFLWNRSVLMSPKNVYYPWKNVDGMETIIIKSINYMALYTKLENRKT